MNQITKQRLIALDLLRGLSVLLVLMRHLTTIPDDAPFRFLLAPLQRGGWVGVDIFFVLSGYLVSGLLFREHLSTGSVSPSRFLIRRGFKIYPAFYVLLVSTTVINLRYGYFDAGRFTVELLFLQSYITGFWNHTWSLAVEEHFYLLLALCSRVRLRVNLTSLFSVIAVGCLILRILTATSSSSFFRVYAPSHLRIDALSCGVLLAWFHNFRPDCFTEFIKEYRRALLIAGILLLLPPFFYKIESTPFIYTFGLTLNYLGAGSLLCAMLATDFRPTPFIRPLSIIGFYSYSIYLWHMPVSVWGSVFLKRILHFNNQTLHAAIYLTGSIIGGIVLAKLIEIPALRLREQITPSESRQRREPPTALDIARNCHVSK